MPAHIYMRLGRYHEAAERNAHAADVDRNYLAGRKLSGNYADAYYTHNLHFLWASLAMEGRRAEALKVARRLTGTITEDEARKDKWKELYLPTPLWSMIRFGQWDELLREPPPPKPLRLQQGIWRLGRGMALSASGRLPGAEGEHLVLTGMAKRLGRDRTPEEKTERTLLKIAERLLAGELAMHRHKYDAGITSLGMGACGRDPHRLSVLRRTARGITSAMFVRAGELVSRQCPKLLTFADGREVHAMPNKA